MDMIIIHDTEGTYGSAIAEFQNPAAQASAHFVVSDAGAVTQMVRESDIAWHAGNWDYNTRAIGIEHEVSPEPGWYTPAMYQASAQSAASICSRWGVPMDRQRRHRPCRSSRSGPRRPVRRRRAPHRPRSLLGLELLPEPCPGLRGCAAQPAPHGPQLDRGPSRQRHGDGELGLCPLLPAADPGLLRWSASPGTSPESPASATTTTATGLQDGVAYTFTVTACNSATVSPDDLARQRVTGPWLRGVLSSAPAAASGSTTRLDVFANAIDSAIWHRSLNGGVWGAWESLGGRLASAPGAVATGPQQLDVFIEGYDQALWHRQTGTGTAWHPGELGGQPHLGPRRCSNPQGAASCDIVKSMTRRLTTVMAPRWTGTAWRPRWESLGGVLLK